MKNFLKRGETYNFFNPRNILIGVSGSITSLLIFYFLGSVDHMIWTSRVSSTDVARSVPVYILFVFLLLLIAFPVIMGKRHGLKSALSTLFFEISFFVVIIVLLLGFTNILIILG